MLLPIDSVLFYFGLAVPVRQNVRFVTPNSINKKQATLPNAPSYPARYKQIKLFKLVMEP